MQWIFKEFGVNSVIYVEGEDGWNLYENWTRYSEKLYLYEKYIKHLTK